MRAVTCRGLQTFGFETAEAASGEEGVTRFADNPTRFSLVLLDLTMPGMTGEETLRALRAIRPGVPIVIMSGFNEADAMGRFGEDAPAAFIQKPYELRELRALLEHVVPA